MKYMIIESLQPLIVEIDSISGYPGNPRQGRIPDIRASLRTYGQYKPVVVQASSGYVVAGNQTLIAMKEEGYTDVAAAFIDVDDAEAARLVAFDNRVSDQAEYDDLALASLLKGIQSLEDGEGLAGTGYTDEDLSAILEGLAADADLPPVEDEEEDLGPAGKAWGVVVTCSDQYEQDDLLQRLEGEGLKVRALN